MKGRRLSKAAGKTGAAAAPVARKRGTNRRTAASPFNLAGRSCLRGTVIDSPSARSTARGQATPLRVLAPFHRLARGWLPVAFGGLLLALAAPAAAAYNVDIDAPRSVRKLLKQHLDLARFATRDDVTDDQFDFLVSATSQQVRNLVATDGYFSP